MPVRGLPGCASSSSSCPTAASKEARRLSTSMWLFSAPHLPAAEDQGVPGRSRSLHRLLWFQTRAEFSWRAFSRPRARASSLAQHQRNWVAFWARTVRTLRGLWGRRRGRAPRRADPVGNWRCRKLASMVGKGVGSALAAGGTGLQVRGTVRPSAYDAPRPT
jgi:hypothetical protein